MQVSDIKARIFVRYQGVAILQNLIITIEISEKKLETVVMQRIPFLIPRNNDSHARAWTAADAFWVRHGAAYLKMFRTGSGFSGCMTFNL